MDRRKELQQQAKEIKTEAGVYQIKNQVNGKVYVESTMNLRTINGREMALDMGSHRNRRLQADWTAFGKENFTIEPLEVLKIKENAGAYYDPKDDLKKLYEQWMERLQPYGERGYHDAREAGK
ncbi:GIY-YIG nuclease family protein [Paenibacillus rigui]|uniref:LuxR family transcriptional regulator n=1 Tax=Paenibacillus rigui TaxID=554312 RepID=A0A229UN69_9BACL|nr:GIY-YIG nuclease family protein [Paenibacillus rigui]OXM84803.1 LuxR family transcriptional regulator [Paenibacillus rigui]